MSRSLNTVSWNVKGLNHPVKRRKVLNHLKQFNAGIIFLQETYLRSADNDRFMASWAGQHFHSTFQAKARGVSILVARGVVFEPLDITADKNGRFVIVTGKLFNMNVVLANVYAPNIDDAAFFVRLFSNLPDLGQHHLILGGDLNCWLDQALDRSSTKPGAVSKSALQIQSFLSECGISDVFSSTQKRNSIHFSPMFIIHILE